MDSPKLPKIFNEREAALATESSSEKIDADINRLAPHAWAGNIVREWQHAKQSGRIDANALSGYAKRLDLIKIAQEAAEEINIRKDNVLTHWLGESGKYDVPVSTRDDVMQKFVVAISPPEVYQAATQDQIANNLQASMKLLVNMGMGKKSTRAAEDKNPTMELFQRVLEKLGSNN